MSKRSDICLQCDESRGAVRDGKLFCVIVDGYWEKEISEEFPRHHWADWGDRELEAMGLPAEKWDAHRRTSWGNLEFVVRDALCERDGHPGDIVPGLCGRCYRVTGSMPPERAGAE